MGEFVKDKAAISNACDKCNALLDAIEWWDGSAGTAKDGLYQADEFVASEDVSRADLGRVVNGYLSLQSFRLFENNRISLDDVVGLIEISGSPENSWVSKQLMLKVLLQNESYSPLIDALLMSGKESSFDWALYLISAMMRPEEYLRHYARDLVGDVTPSENVERVHKKVSPFLRSQRFNMFERAKDLNVPMGVLTIDLRFNEDAGRACYESTAALELTSIDEDKNKSTWKMNRHTFYHPVTLNIIGFTWEFTISEGPLVKKRFTYVGIETREGYRFIRDGSGSKSISTLSFGDGGAVSLLPGYNIEKAILSGNYHVGDKMVSHGMDISQAGIELVTERSVIKKIDDYIHVETISKAGDSSETAQLVLFDRSALMAVVSSQGSYFVAEGKENPLSAGVVNTRIKPIYASNGLEIEPDIADSLTLKLEGIELAPSLGERYKWKRIGKMVWRLTCEKERAPKDIIEEPLSNEMERFLKPTVSIQSNDPEIMLRAKQVTKGSENSWEKVRSIVAWLDGNMGSVYDTSHPNAVEVLHNMSGDCTEYALLFMALARSIGIPSRGITGLVYVSDKKEFAAHRWVEVYINGRWLTIDPAWGQSIADVAHIALFESDLPDQERLLNIIQDLKITVEDIRK